MHFRIGTAFYYCPRVYAPVLRLAHRLPVGRVRSWIVTDVLRVSREVR